MINSSAGDSGDCAKSHCQLSAVVIMARALKTSGFVCIVTTANEQVEFYWLILHKQENLTNSLARLSFLLLIHI